MVLPAVTITWYRYSTFCPGILKLLTHFYIVETIMRASDTDVIISYRFGLSRYCANMFISSQRYTLIPIAQCIIHIETEMNSLLYSETQGLKYLYIHNTTLKTSNNSAAIDITLTCRCQSLNCPVYTIIRIKLNFTVSPQITSK